MHGRRLFSLLFLAGLLGLILLRLGLAGPAQARPGTLFSLVPAQVTRPPGAATGAEAGSLELLGQVGGLITSVVSDGDYLYVNSGPRLLVLSAEPEPQVVGRSDLLPADVLGVALSGKTAIVSTSRELYTVDVTDPARPAVLGRLAHNIYPLKLLASGAYAYVVGLAGWNSVAIVDVGDPAQPLLVGEVAPGWEWPVTAAAAQNDLLLLAELYQECGKSGCHDVAYQVELIDAGRPGEPEVLAQIPLSSSVSDVVLDGTVAIVVDGSNLWGLDVSDPSAPLRLAPLRLPYDFRPAGGLVIADGIVSLLGDRELLLADLSLPAAPVLLARLPLPVPGVAMAWAGELLAVAGGCGVRMIDPFDLRRPVAGRYVSIQPGGRSGALLAADGLLYSAGVAQRYSANPGSCLQVLDAGDPAAPALLSSRDFAESIFRLHKEDDLLYVAEARRLSIFDVADPANLSLLSAVAPPASCEAFTFAVAGDFAYAKCVVQPATTVHILDASDPLAPAWAGEYPLPDPVNAYRIAATPGILYLIAELVGTETDVEMFVVDVGDPAQPAVLATLPPAGPGGSLDRMAVAFPYVYLRRYDRLQIIDVRDPAHPYRAGLAAAVPWSTLAAAEDILYMVDDPLVAYLHSPVPFVTTVACPQGCRWVQTAAAEQDLLFTAGLESGLFTYRYTPPEPPDWQTVFLPLGAK